MTRSRRLVLSALSLAAVLTMALSACSSGSGGAASEPASTGAAPQGGDITFAIDQPVAKLDPATASRAQDGRIMRSIYDSLVSKDENHKVIPWLATSWKISNGNKTYTFTLRDDVKFQDGTPFNAEAVCYNFDRTTDPATASPISASALGSYSSCTAPDATTAVVTLKAPFAQLLSNLASPFAGIVSPTAAKAATLSEFALQPVGSGPFEFVSYTPNDRVILKQNPDYEWAPADAEHRGPAYVDTVTFQIIPDSTVRLGSLNNGSVQGVWNVPATQAAAVKADPKATFYAEVPTGSPFQLFFNQSRPPFDNKDVRIAVREALNIDAAVKAFYFGFYQRAWTPLNPGMEDYDKALEGSFKYDPKAAAKALDAAGWKVGSDGIRVKNGVPLTIEYSEGSPNRENRQDLAELFKANLAEIGVKVNIALNPASLQQASIMQNTYDITGLSLAGAGPNLLDNLYNPANIPTPGHYLLNQSHTNDPELTAELVAVKAELDPAKREKMFASIQKRIVDQAYSVAVYVPTDLVATKGITGLQFDEGNYPSFYNVSLAK